MQVILLEKIARLGNVGDTVHVKPGYGRNYLLPFGKAMTATRENIAYFEERRAELEKAASDRLTNAQGRARDMQALGVVEIAVAASEQGKLFGSVGPREIADAVSAKGCELARGEVRMPDGAIKEVGEYQVLLQLHSDLVQPLDLVVVAA